jgi:hypothetical protein
MESNTESGSGFFFHGKTVKVGMSKVNKRGKSNTLSLFQEELDRPWQRMQQRQTHGE